MYKLIKSSSPSWEEDFNNIEDLFAKVDDCVCDMCKINSYEEMKNYFDSNEHSTSYTEKDILNELEYCCVGKDYGSMSTTEKVDELLHTACGCEYMLEVGR